jgi:(1->4)-alpha-D-glucan 1-alpha-D-glucosylmutase
VHRHGRDEAAAVTTNANAFRATYRLQFREGFDFAAAADIAGYLARLGISHVYASPVFAARSGSSHGYDVTDFNELDASLGGRAGFERMVEALQRHGLGLILDFVPNHMAASVENPWWHDVLAHGEASAHADAFDIDWDRGDGRLLLPVLGDAYGAVLERGEITIAEEEGQTWVHYYDHRFPTSPDSPDPAAVHEFLEAQHYRLAHWRLAPDAINYRRFFDVNDLAVIRVDRREVYERVHALVLELIGAGLVDGLRLDHIDGLKDPAGYLERLQDDASAAAGRKPFYLLVEKILGPGETLRRSWPVAGTTGYEFTNLVTGLQIDAPGAGRMRERYAAFTGDRRSFDETAQAAKRFILSLSFSGELRVLADFAHQLAQDDLVTREIGAEALRRAITEVLVALPVYRTYVSERGAAPEDVALINAVCDAAAQRLGAESADAVAFLRSLMKAETGEPEFAIRLQQLTGPLMAKSLEDTAFYRWVPLLARNEVGGEPGGPLPSPDTFHRENQQRLEDWPHALLTTATHDTKRGEDARARLAALSSVPDVFAEAVERWWKLHQPLRHRAAPNAKDAWLFYQAVLGAWPADLALDDRAGLADLARRMRQYLEKALREAKERTRWTDIDADYETAVQSFAGAALDPRRSGQFLNDMRALIDLIAPASIANSLAQLVFKLTAPGVPDVYQGTEAWDFSLVDPDNRRPVDYAGLARDLDTPEASPKQRVIRAVLALRREDPELFDSGDYLALEIRGPAANAVVAYARTCGNRALVVCALRRGAPETLEGSELLLDDRLAQAQWTDVLAGRPLPALALADVLSASPLAVVHCRTS